MPEPLTGFQRGLRLLQLRSRLFPRSRVVALLTRCVDLDDDRHSRSQPVNGTLVMIEDNLYRDALRDLGEVARGVVGWQQRELRPARRGDLFHMAFQLEAGKGVNGDYRRIALADIGQLSLFIISLNPDVARSEERRVGKE